MENRLGSTFGDPGILDAMSAEAKPNAHPVIALLQKHSQELIRVNAEGLRAGFDGKQEVLSTNLGFFGDTIEATGDFSLTPNTIVAIMGFMKRKLKLDYYAQVDIATLVSSKYAIQGIPSPEQWRGFPREFLETMRIPEIVRDDADGVTHAFSRLRALRNIVNECVVPLEFREWIEQESEILVERVRYGDTTATEAESILNRKILKVEGYFSDIRETFNSGLTRNTSQMANALGNLEAPSAF